MTEPNVAPRRDRRVVVFGEVLFDRFPDGKEVLGGAPFNVAWNLQGLGRQPLLVSRVGADELGARILAAMRDWGMDTSGIQQDRHRATGTVDVTVVDGEPSYDIVADRAYDAIAADELPPIGPAAVLYHGSLAFRSHARSALERLIRGPGGPGGAEGRPPDSIFFDVNLRAPWWDESTVLGFLRTADEVKMNESELERLVPRADKSEDRAAALIAGCGIERLHLTRGSRGASTYTARSGPFDVRPAGEATVVDAVGAGDAFSSVLILGRLEGWPLERTLERAQAFAGEVVGLRGATTTDREFYAPFVSAWGGR